MNTPIQDFMINNDHPRYHRRGYTESLNKARSLHRRIKLRGCHKQFSSHGCGRFSVQFFDEGKLIADFTL